MSSPRREVLVHLAYMDDSDTKQKANKWQVVAGVLLEDRGFNILEYAMSAVSKMLIPAEKMESFSEFHACELYGGYGVFQGIDDERRYSAIKLLLSFLNGGGGMQVIYGAVNLQALQGRL